MEELEAIDWYNQRTEVAADWQLREILEHNRDDEKEHAAMLIQYISSVDPAFKKQLKKFLKLR